MLLGGTALLLLPASQASAQSAWVGAVSNDWFTAGNWSNGVPDGTAATTIDTNSPNGTVIDTNLADTDTLDVGVDATGELTIQSGGDLHSAAAGFIGLNSSGVGTVTVTGAGSTWTTAGDLNVGFDGTGTLWITNGGQVLDNYGSVAGAVGSSGTVHVEGTGSTWTAIHDLTLGNSGTAILTVSDGGKVEDVTGYLGWHANGSGTATVTGAGSAWNNSGDLHVGYAGGTGTLNVENGGKVENAYGSIGGNAGSDGTVHIDGTGSQWVNNQDLYVGDLGNGVLTVGSGGEVSVAGVIDIALELGSTGALNIGAAPGDAATAPGTVTATSIDFGAGQGTINFNHTGSNYTFSVPITGAGGINQIAGVTDLTGNSPTYTGQIIVTGGTLKVDGDMTSSVIDVDGGSLGGHGMLNLVNVNNGGTIAPGDGIDTLTADVINFDTGSFYQVHVDDAGNSDLIDVSNLAIINGGTVKVQAAAGNYTAATQYTILTAANGLSGNQQFDGVTSNLIFLTPTLTYDANNVYLTLAPNGVTFSSIGDTPNQIATGGGVGSLGAGNPIYDAVLNLSIDQARDAFDQLSGEIYPSEATAMLEDSHFLRDAALDRLRAALSSMSGSAVWGRGFGSLGHWDSDGNAAALDRSIGGFFAGADAPIYDNWRLGVLGGYGHSAFGVPDRDSSGASNDYHLGLYGGGDWGDVSVRMGAAYTGHDVTTSRSVAFPGISDSLTSGYWAGATQLFGELGYDMQAGPTTFEPFVNLAYVNQHAAGFTEKGGDAALTSTRFDVDATFATLGVRGSTDFDLNGISVMARGTLAWRHDFNGTAPKATMQFASGGDDFTIAGVPVAHDVAVVDAGLDLTLSPTATLGVSYGGQFGSGRADQSLRANFSVKF